MTEDLLAACRAYSDLSKSLKAADEAVDEAVADDAASFNASLTRRAQVENAWRTARDEVVEAAQQWAAHYG